MNWLPPALHGVIGVGFAHAGPDILARYTSRLGLNNFGFGGVILSGVSTALGASLLQWLAGMLPKAGIIGKFMKGIGRNVFVGGMIWTALRLVQTVWPTAGFNRWLPAAGGGGIAGLGYYGYGHYPGQYGAGHYGPVSGLGMVTSPEELVAGESLARQLSGLGQGGMPVPIEDLRGMNDWMELSGMQGMQGMNDWVELAPDSSLVMQGFSPGAEGF